MRLFAATSSMPRCAVRCSGTTGSARHVASPILDILPSCSYQRKSNGRHALSPFPARTPSASACREGHCRRPCLHRRLHRRLRPTLHTRRLRRHHRLPDLLDASARRSIPGAPMTDAAAPRWMTTILSAPVAGTTPLAPTARTLTRRRLRRHLRRHHRRRRLRRRHHRRHHRR